MSRSRIGLGRMLRGTDQATFSAFWRAWPRPSEPYVAATMPTTVLVVDPCSRSGRPSSSPMIGKVPRAESIIRSWKSGLPCRTQPKIVTASSSRGKTASTA